MMIHSTLSALSLNITDGKHGDCENSPTSGYYFISCKDVRDGTIHYEDARQITERDFFDAHKRTLFEPNDILITNSGTIGRMAFVTDTPQTSKTTFQKSVAIVKPNPNKIIPKYLYYVLLNSIDSFITQANGSAQKNLLLSTMRSFNLFIDDDKQVQARIASILSAYDDLIENNQKQIKLLEEAAQRLYKEWFVDLRFPGWKNTKIVDGVPEGWEKTTFGHICTVKKHIINIQENIPSDTPYIGLEHMPRHDFCLSEWGYAQSVSSSKFFFKKGDILFGKIRPYFHKVGFAICNGICSTDAIVMSTEKQLWSLLLMTASSDEFVNHSYQTCKEGSKMPRADWRSMELFPVLIATHELMNSFNLIIESICSKIEKLALENNLLSESFDVLLQKIMSEKNGGLI